MFLLKIFVWGVFFTFQNFLAHFFITKNAVFLTRKRGFFATDVALRPKNAQNERLCNLLIISNKTF
jgi:hypothetical protein